MTTSTIATTIAAPILEVSAPLVSAPLVAEATSVAVPELAKVAKPSALKSLFKAVTKAPGKTAVIVIGTGAAVAGTVYLVKKVRANKAAKADDAIEEVTSKEAK